MSHFAVLVIGDNVEEQLAPYQENNMEDCPKEFLEFNDVEEECRNEWEKETRKEFYCASSSSWGQEINEEAYNKVKDLPVGESVAVSISKEGFAYFTKGKRYKVYYSAEHKYPEGLHRWVECTEIISTDHPNPDVCFTGTIELTRIEPPTEISLKDYYMKEFENEYNREGTEEEVFKYYMDKWHGYEIDEETGKYGYWENPNAKWDWYQVGGRWTGYFKLKEGHNGQLGERSWASGKAEENTADVLYKGSIDIDGMVKEAQNLAADKWEFVHSIITDSKNVKPWSYFLYKMKNADSYDIDMARDEYHAQEKVKRFADAIKGMDNPLVDGWEGIDYYLVPKSDFVLLAGESAIAPFAFVKDGIWYEKGEMGWFACVSNEKDKEQWNNEFMTMFKSLPDDTLITVVDCHI